MMVAGIRCQLGPFNLALQIALKSFSSACDLSFLGSELGLRNCCLKSPSCWGVELSIVDVSCPEALTFEAGFGKRYAWLQQNEPKIAAGWPHGVVSGIPVISRVGLPGLPLIPSKSKIKNTMVVMRQCSLRQSMTLRFVERESSCQGFHFFAPKVEAEWGSCATHQSTLRSEAGADLHGPSGAATSGGRRRGSRGGGGGPP